MLHSLSFDTFYMSLLSATEKNWPQIIDAVVVWFQNLAFFTGLKSYNLHHPHSYQHNFNRKHKK